MGARADRPIKAAGEWLRTNSTGPLRILDSSTIVPFHAKASHFWLPCCDEKAALRYIDNKNINVVVVRKSEAEAPPYLKNWFENGIPDPRAELVHAVDIGNRESIKIYRIKQ
jgi:hypothetical protein